MKDGTADAHDCLEKVVIWFGHNRVYTFTLILHVMSLPELIINDNHEPSGRLDLSRLTEDALWYYKSLTGKCLRNIDVPLDAVLCCNIHCNTQSLNRDLCLNNSCRAFCQKRVKQHNLGPGWKKYEAFRNWVLSGKARYGPEFKHIRHAMLGLKMQYVLFKRPWGHEGKFYGQKASLK